jgi:hypothetical protein
VNQGGGYLPVLKHLIHQECYTIRSSSDVIKLYPRYYFEYIISYSEEISIDNCVSLL